MSEIDGIDMNVRSYCSHSEDPYLALDKENEDEDKHVLQVPAPCPVDCSSCIPRVRLKQVRREPTRKLLQYHRHCKGGGE